MTTRSFELVDGASDKFWTIALDGKQFTVNFGRRGTSGQTQAKDFGSDDAARQACDKLIAEKLKKGYSEVNGAARQVAIAAPPKPAPAKPAAAAPAVPKPTVEPTVEPAAPEGRVQLSAVDWMRATWRPRVPAPKPAVRPFDRKAAVEAVEKLLAVAAKNHQWWAGWSKLEVPAHMSPEEARFWLHAIAGLNRMMYRKTPNRWIPGLSDEDRALAAGILKDLETLDLSREMGWSEAAKLFGEPRPSVLGLIPLLHLFPLSESAEEVAELASRPDWSDLGSAILRTHILQYLAESEWELLARALRRQLSGPAGQHEANVFRLAAALGGGKELARVIEQWPDQYPFGYFRWPQDLVFGLPDGALVSREMRRLKYRLLTPAHVRAWLAHTEDRELGLVADSIVEQTNREEAADLVDALASAVTSAVAAPAMLRIVVESRAPKKARQWLLEHPAETIAGLANVAVGKGKLAEAAVDLLADLDRAGHGALLEQHLGPVALQKATAYQAEAAKEPQEVLDEARTPAGLAAAFAEGAKIKAKASVWAVPSLLPVIVTAGGRFNEEQVGAVIRALMKNDLACPHPLLLAVRCYATPVSLDRFVWALFERWLADGAPAKEKWALGAVGLYGGDRSAISLAGLIRVWPGEGKHQMAAMGLECLRAIGSDTALIQISGISQRVKFQAIKARAKQCLEEIAADLQLTRPQLEDRVVPDCGLDDNGSRVFDFGPRQFRLVLGPGLKPLVVDGDNQRKPDLPKPNSKDDAVKAEEAIAEWKLVKKQLAETVKVQTRRLEQALVTQRRWTVEEFESLFLRHPFLMNMAPWLVWGMYGLDGTLIATFRVREDRSLGDEHDGPVTLSPDVAIGLAHPMQLRAESLAAWGELFSDYEILPPFPQLGRPVLRLTPEEAACDTIERHMGMAIPTTALVGTLERLGWEKAAVADGGGYAFHGKEFGEAGVTAILDHETIFIGMLAEAEPTSMNSCYFIRGGFDRHAWDYERRQVHLGEIDPLIVSEVLSDLATVASKGEA